MCANARSVFVRPFWAMIPFLLCALCASPAMAYHSGDTNGDYRISLSELLRLIQFFNSPGFSCLSGTEDGYNPGPGDQSCDSHDTDYAPQDWSISLSELLRFIQFYNSQGYGFSAQSEDGFLPIFEPLETDDTVPGDLGSIGSYVDGLSDDVMDDTTKDEVQDLLDQAELKFVQGLPCDAADILELILAIAQALYEQGGATQNAMEKLYAWARFVQYNMVLTNLDQGGCANHPGVGQEPEPEVQSEDTQGLDMSMDFGEPKTLPVTQDGENYTELIMPGIDPQGGEPGAPAIPVAAAIFAAPPDAFVEMDADIEDGETFGANLLPNIEQPEDKPGPFVPDDFANKPFFKNPNIYQVDRFYPPNPCEIVPLGRARGMDFYQVVCHTARFNPVSKRVVLHKRANVSIRFANGPNGFQPEFSRDPFESNNDVFTGGLLNRSAVGAASTIPDLGIFVNYGEEFMILTHPNFRAAADALAEWKNQKGIMTQVYECGTGSGITDRDTREEIDAFIESHYASVHIKPRYILLLGDAEYIPAWYVTRAGKPTKTIGTDHPYAVIPVTIFGITFDLLPTFALGRIPVDTLDQANTVVNKIIDYEKNPPGSPFIIDDFYKRISFHAQFQCCRTDVDQVGTDQRTFIEMPESVRPTLLAMGYQVPRNYLETVDGGCSTCDPPRPAYTRDATPRRYYDGTPLPADLAPGSGFMWNGTTQRVIDSFNNGSFLILHRDHGGPSGWGDPPFSTANFASLNNGAFLPVLYSINCSSGVFDNETSGGDEGVMVGSSYFSELLLRRANGGVVGIIGDTRVSPSWPNSVLARGFFDATFPNVVPTYGNNTSKRRLGDILLHGKFYLLSQLNVAVGVGANEVRNEFFLYHVIGDPTLEMWTSDPQANLFLGTFVLNALSRSSAKIGFEALDGTEITAYQYEQDQGLKPVGRGYTKNNEAVIDFFNLPDPGPLYLSANAENFVAADGSVNIAFE